MTHEQNIMYILGDIQGTVKSIKEHQDKQNGWIEKQSARISVVEDTQLLQKGEAKGMAMVISSIVSGIGLVGSIIYETLKK